MNNQEKSDKCFWSVKELAAYLQVSKSLIYAQIEKKKSHASG